MAKEAFWILTCIFWRINTSLLYLLFISTLTITEISLDSFIYLFIIIIIMRVAFKYKSCFIICFFSYIFKIIKKFLNIIIYMFCWHHNFKHN